MLVNEVEKNIKSLLGVVEFSFYIRDILRTIGEKRYNKKKNSFHYNINVNELPKELKKVKRILESFKVYYYDESNSKELQNNNIILVIDEKEKSISINTTRESEFNFSCSYMLLYFITKIISGKEEEVADGVFLSRDLLYEKINSTLYEIFAVVGCSIVSPQDLAMLGMENEDNIEQLAAEFGLPENVIQVTMNFYGRIFN